MIHGFVPSTMIIYIEYCTACPDEFQSNVDYFPGLYSGGHALPLGANVGRKNDLGLGLVDGNEVVPELFLIYFFWRTI
jgi:hypothetical protein